MEELRNALVERQRFEALRWRRNLTGRRRNVDGLLLILLLVLLLLLVGAMVTDMLMGVLLLHSVTNRFDQTLRHRRPELNRTRWRRQRELRMRCQIVAAVLLLLLNGDARVGAARWNTVLAARWNETDGRTSLLGELMLLLLAVVTG